MSYEPLTPEEEAAVRDSMRVKWGLPLSPQSFQGLTARLLATLDAEREVARANAELADHWKAELDALREAILLGAEWIGWDTIYCYWCDNTQAEGHAPDCLRATLAKEPTDE